MTVDTGSNVSIVRPDVIHRSSTMPVIEPVNTCLRTVTGETAPIQGRAQLQIEIGSYSVPHEMWVANISDECILGLDFLEQHECQVDLKTNALLIGGEEIPLQKPTTATITCCRVIAKEPVRIPPRAEMVIPGRVDTQTAGEWGLLEPEGAAPSSRGLLVGKTLVNLQHGVIPVRILNLSFKEQRIKRGTELGRCETMLEGVIQQEGKCETMLEGAVEQEGKLTHPGSRMPKFLEQLYQRSIAKLKPGEHKLVYALLCDYSDVFSSGPRDLGRTDRVKHQIDGAGPRRATSTCVPDLLG